MRWAHYAVADCVAFLLNRPDQRQYDQSECAEIAANLEREEAGVLVVYRGNLS